MKGLSTELKVGLFAVFVIIILAFMTFKVGGLDWLKKEGFTVYVEFRNIAGLDEKTKVKIAGVDAGVIEKIELKDGIARLKLRMRKDVTIYSDATASIKATGLLGDKYLEIKVGSREPALKNGESIKEVIELVDIDDMVRKLSRVSENISDLAMSLNEALGTDESKKALKESVLNLEEITSNLSQTIIVNDRKMRNVLDNINKLTASLNEVITTNREPLKTTLLNMEDFSGRLKTDGPELVSNLSRATRELKEIIEENKNSLKSTIDSFNNVAKKIDSGEGTLGKLVKDDKLYESINKAAEGLDRTIGAIDRFKTFITFQSDYLMRQGDGKGAFYVTLQPKPDKYYILGVVGDPLGRVSTKETITSTPTGTTKIKKKEIEKEIEFTAQFAKRFDNTGLRIGVTESTFGAGADYFFKNDKAKASIDIWDFSNDEEDSKNPHLKVGVDYFVFKNLFVSAGADNILNKKKAGGYVGAGIRFEDEDFKYLFGNISRLR
ncbi:MAG: MCE family protein [Nitrospirae bacterium]|nr:MCE family protein [Nitrospirota bacterium]